LNGNRRRSALKCVVAILCAASFLTVTLGSIYPVSAAEEWEVWPKKPVQPGVEVPEPSGAAQAGEAAGTKAGAGLSAGTIGWIALGAAAVIGIAVAAGGGGGGGGGSSTPPSHAAP
jgi:hypothetical protein